MVKNRQGELSGLSLITGGFVLVAMSIGGYAIGVLIDSRIGSAPKGAIIGFVLGTIFGFWDLYRIAKQVMNQQPIPTREQQEAAKANWDETENPEGNRDEAQE